MKSRFRPLLLRLLLICVGAAALPSCVGPGGYYGDGYYYRDSHRGRHHHHNYRHRSDHYRHYR